MKNRSAITRVERRHYVFAPADRADRESAADDLSEHRQVGLDLENLLPAAFGQSERDHFIDHEHRACATRRFGHALEKSRRRLDDPRRAEHPLEEYCRDFRATLRQRCLERGRLAEIREHRALAVHPGQPDFQIVVRSVIAVTRHQDELAAGEAPRDVRREHARLRP